MPDNISAEQGEISINDLLQTHENGEEFTNEQVDVIADIAITSLREILACFGETTCSIDEYDGGSGELILDISGGDLAVLIGRHGRVLDSLQLLVSSLLSKKLGFHFPIVVDIEGYKNRRKQKVQEIALTAAARAKRTGRVHLRPMSAYERRLVHLALLNDEQVVTHSEGEDLERHVVITRV